MKDQLERFKNSNEIKKETQKIVRRDFLIQKYHNKGLVGGEGPESQLVPNSYKEIRDKAVAI